MGRNTENTAPVASTMGRNTAEECPIFASRDNKPLRSDSKTAKIIGGMGGEEPSFDGFRMDKIGHAV